MFLNQSNNCPFSDSEDEDDWIPLGEDHDAIEESSPSSSPPTHEFIRSNDTSVASTHVRHDAIPTGPNVVCGRNVSFSQRSNSSNSTRNNRNSYDNKNSWRRGPASTSTTRNDTASTRTVLDGIRERHERNLSLKQSFVNRPIVLFPKILFFHLLSEFWNSDPAIRLGEYIP